MRSASERPSGGPGGRVDRGTRRPPSHSVTQEGRDHARQGMGGCRKVPAFGSQPVTRRDPIGHGVRGAQKVRERPAFRGIATGRGLAEEPAARRGAPLATYRLRAYRCPPPREDCGRPGAMCGACGLAQVGEDARDRSAVRKTHSLIFSSFPPAEAAEAVRTLGSSFPSGRRYGYVSKDSSAISCILSWRKMSGSWCLS